MTNQTLTQTTKVKIRYYEGANNILTLYFPSGEKVKVFYADQRWLEPLISFVKNNGKHKEEKRWGYSSVARMRMLYRPDVWIAEMDVNDLVKLVTSYKSWTRSYHAREIVDKLSQVINR